jgi:ammonium transporter Rh
MIAIIIGCLAGALSTFGFSKITPYLNSKGYFDVCGIHNLHAVPGLLGGLYSALIFGIYTVLPPSRNVNGN